MTNTTNRTTWTLTGRQTRKVIAMAENRERPSGLSLEERETIINFDEGPGPAHIFTYNKSWQRHLEGRLGLKPTRTNGYGGREYQIDKKRIRPPRAPVKMSAATRAKMAERLAAARRKSPNLSKRTHSTVSKPRGKSADNGKTQPTPRLVVGGTVNG